MFEEQGGSVEKDRSRLIVILSGIAVLVVIGLIILVTSFGDKSSESDFSGPGSPEFDSYIENLKIMNIQRFYGERLNVNYGRIVFHIQNAGDKEVTGIRVRGRAIGTNDEELKTKLITPIPSRQNRVLKPGQKIEVEVNLEPVPESWEIKDMPVEIIGLKIKG